MIGYDPRVVIWTALQCFTEAAVSAEDRLVPELAQERRLRLTVAVFQREKRRPNRVRHVRRPRRSRPSQINGRLFCTSWSVWDDQYWRAETEQARVRGQRRDPVCIFAFCSGRER